MAGKSGMSFMRIKDPSKVRQINITVDGDSGEMMDYILSVAQTHKWSMSQAAREIILAAKNQKIKV